MTIYSSKKQAVISSLFDKLIDEEPNKKREATIPLHQKKSELCMSICRDLENLLNTRQSCLDWSPAWKELNISLLTYGMNDFMSYSPINAESQQAFCKKLSAIIQQFETRLKNVRVTLLQNSKKQDQILRLRIEGLLDAESTLEVIVFDSMIEPETQSFSLVKVDD